MNKKSGFLKLFVGLFAVLIAFHFSANSALAQCGINFKTNVQIQKIANGTSESLLLNDWTGDGKSDFWISKYNSSTSTYDIRIYPAKPTGYWDWDNPIVLTTPFFNLPYVGLVDIKDFNSDGKMDIVSYSSESGIGYGYRIYRNTGTSLVAMPSFSDPDLTYYSRLNFVDLNNDNLLDWIYVYRNDSINVRELRYKLQNPDGSFGNRNTIISGSPANAFWDYLYIKTGDFDGDGRVDIVYNSNNTNVPNRYVLVRNLGGGNFQAGAPTASDLEVSNVADMNNDGRADVIRATTDSLIVYYGQANGTFDRRESPGTFGVPAELNGDGYMDVIGIYSSNPYYTVMINNGASGGFTKTIYPKNFSQNFVDFRIEDFSGDGKADLFDPSTISANSKIYNMFGDELLVIRENTCQSGETKSINFEGNGSADVAAWNPSNGNWTSKNAVWGNGADTSSKNFQWGLGSHGDVPAPGDFDGDGKTDYAVYRNSTGVWYIFRSSDSSWMTFQFGTTGDIAVPNDYNGGGKTDIAVFRPSNGGWYIWYSETQQFLGVQFGQNGDKPVAADYDGDGKTDISVWRPSTGVWYYLRSSNNSFAAILWGIGTDKPVPADYDGDGKADLAIYRGGDWWILRSSNNAAVGIQWGTANDVPMPVYRNLISAEIMLYRPYNNTWNSFSSRFANGITNGGSQDVPVYFGLPNN